MTVMLGLLTVFGPISMDLYLPVLPALTRDLGTTPSTAQLTVSACLLGLATGQLVAGPISDRVGRRRPALIGVGAYALTSLACALAPNIGLLIVARLAQGLTGSVGIVIAQAGGRDLYTGRRLAGYYGRLTALGGFAAIIGPTVGGLLAKVTDWRGIFVVLAGTGVLILVLAAVLFRETLPEHRRSDGGLARTGRALQQLITDARFLAAVLTIGFGGGALFAYVAGATFVLQDIYGLSPQEYALAFGLNSAGVMGAGLLTGLIARRWSMTAALLLGLALGVAGAGLLLATALLHLPLVVLMASMLSLLVGISLMSPPVLSAALMSFPALAGTAASVLGLARYGFGGVAAPLVGLAGPDSAVPLGAVTLASMLAGAAVVAFDRRVLARR